MRGGWGWGLGRPRGVEQGGHGSRTLLLQQPRLCFHNRHQSAIKRLLCTPTVGEESRRACGRVGDTRAWVFLGLGARIRSMGLIRKMRGLRGTVQSLLALLTHTHTLPTTSPPSPLSLDFRRYENYGKYALEGSV